MTKQPHGATKRRPSRGRYPPVLVPVLDGFDMLGIGITKGYQMIADGVLDSVMIGRRRYLKTESLMRLASPHQAATFSPDDVMPALKGVAEALDAEREPDPRSVETAINGLEEMLAFLRTLSTPTKAEQAARDAAADPRQTAE
ncbi:MAG TPA: hypothetical protein VIH81_13450 [Roseiarcus sp.]